MEGWIRERYGARQVLLTDSGTSALALAMLHVVVQENLFDSDFVTRWCYGFDELKEHVQKYTPFARATGIGSTAPCADHS